MVRNIYVFAGNAVEDGFQEDPHSSMVAGVSRVPQEPGLRRRERTQTIFNNYKK
jgi:hypothetical protein